MSLIQSILSSDAGWFRQSIAYNSSTVKGLPKSVSTASTSSFLLGWLSSMARRLETEWWSMIGPMYSMCFLTLAVRKSFGSPLNSTGAIANW